MQWVWKYHHHYHRCRRQRNFMRWKISSRLPLEKASQKKGSYFSSSVKVHSLLLFAIWLYPDMGLFMYFAAIFLLKAVVPFLKSQSHDLVIYSNKQKVVLEENFYSLQLNQHQSHQAEACKTLIQCLTCLRRRPRQPQELWRQLRSQPLQQTI